MLSHTCDHALIHCGPPLCHHAVHGHGCARQHTDPIAHMEQFGINLLHARHSTCMQRRAHRRDGPSGTLHTRHSTRAKGVRSQVPVLMGSSAASPGASGQSAPAGLASKSTPTNQRSHTRTHTHTLTGLVKWVSASGAAHIAWQGGVHPSTSAFYAAWAHPQLQHVLCCLGTTQLEHVLCCLGAPASSPHWHRQLQVWLRQRSLQGQSRHILAASIEHAALQKIGTDFGKSGPLCQGGKEARL